MPAPKPGIAVRTDECENPNMVLLLLACFDYHIVPWDKNGNGEDASSLDGEARPPLGGGEEDDAERPDEGNDDPEEPEDEEEEDEGTDAEDGQSNNTPPGQTEDNPRKPTVGDIAISELMVNPEAVHDKFGEYIELANLTPAYITLEGLTVTDNNLDGITLPALIIEPHGLLVLCASDSTWDNGGVSCDHDYDYDSLGYGFAMSNDEDEVILTKPNGKELDRVVWKDAGWAVAGASMGVDPDSLNVDDNDALSDWCDQWGYLPGGDSGSPGQENDWCW